MEYYFFNVTNAKDFLAGGKAAVKQIGPYTYRYVGYKDKLNVCYYTERRVAVFLKNLF